MNNDPDIRISISEEEPSLNISISEEEPSLSISIDSSPSPVFPIYTGEIVVTPKAFEEQILETKNHVLSDDITVEEIPYSEVSNPSGGYTVSIAS